MGVPALATTHVVTEETVQPAGPPRVAREAVSLGVGVALVYGLTLSAVPALTHDSMGYLQAIEAGGHALFHPHHLAYNALARGWLDALDAVGLGGDPLPRVELLNALLGGCAAALVWTILRVRGRLDRGAALAAVAGVAVSFGVWFYSVSVEVYLLPLVLLLAALLVLTAPGLTPGVMAGAGALNGLAVVAHQVNVLFAVVALVVASHGVARREVVRRLGAYGAAAAAVVIPAYAAVLAFAVRPGSAGGASGWMTRYAQSDTYWTFSPKAPVQAAAGLGRALVGGQFAFRIGSVRDRLSSLFSGKSLDDEAFLVRDLPPALAALLIALAALGIGLLLLTVAAGAARGRRSGVPDAARTLVRALVAWLFVYAAFFLLWEPVNPEFWIPQATALWMLAAVLAQGSRRWVTALGIAACAIGVANLVGTILPATDESNDVYAVRYRAVADVAGEGDVVVVDPPHLGLGYAERYTDARPVAAVDYDPVVSVEEGSSVPPDELADRLEREIDAGHVVVVDVHLLDSPSTPEAERLGRVLARRFGERWYLLDVPGPAPGWYVVEP